MIMLPYALAPTYAHALRWRPPDGVRVSARLRPRSVSVRLATTDGGAAVGPWRIRRPMTKEEVCTELDWHAEALLRFADSALTAEEEAAVEAVCGAILGGGGHVLDVSKMGGDC